MSLVLGDNFSYQGAKPLDARLKYDTLAQMKAMADSVLYDGCLAFCKEDSKTYQWISTNEVDSVTGKWREFKSGSDGGGIIDISSKSNNAIKNITRSINPTEDGLYAEDLSTIVNSISLSQKTVNSDLDYCFVGFWNTTNSNYTVTCARGAAIPFNTKFEGNLEFNSTNKAIKLKAGHRYKLHYQCKKSEKTNDANHIERFYNETTSEWLKMTCSNVTTEETCTMEEIYVPTVDCEVSVRNCWCHATSFSMRVNTANLSSEGPGLRTIDCESAFIVIEIGKTVTVDPVAYLSKDGNLEETPVGSIISYMGNNAPKHYLACDGSEYNIADYSELAIHIKESFGSFNYFGGDGVTTFAVPNLSGEFLRGTGTNSHANQGSGASVGAHQDATEELDAAYSAKYNYKQTLAITSKAEYETTKNVDSYILNADSGYLDEQLNIDKFASNPNNRVAYTARPTNTSVLYCIKYETTHKVFFGDQTTYKVSVPITYNFPQTSQMVLAEFDTANAEDDISMLGSSSITSQGDAFVAPMDGYYHATFMFPEQADIPGTKVTYYSTYVYKNGIVIGGSNRQDNSTNIRLPLNESFTLKLKKGDTINVGVYISGQTAAFTRNGQATFCLVNTLNENKTAELINKPNTWVVGQEYDFGDGVYGQRFTGSVTHTAARTAQDIVLTSTIPDSLISSGGTWNRGQGLALSIGQKTPVTNTSENIELTSAIAIDSKRGLIVRFYNNVAQTSTYDIWVKYTKTS